MCRLDYEIKDVNEKLMNASKNESHSKTSLFGNFTTSEIGKCYSQNGFFIIKRKKNLNLSSDKLLVWNPNFGSEISVSFFWIKLLSADRFISKTHKQIWLVLYRYIWNGCSVCVIHNITKISESEWAFVHFNFYRENDRQSNNVTVD